MHFCKRNFLEDPFLELSAFYSFSSFKFCKKKKKKSCHWAISFPNGKYCINSLDAQSKVFKYPMSLYGDIGNFSVGVATKGSHVRRLAKSTENKAHLPWLRLSLLSLNLCIELKHALLLIHMELVLNQTPCSLILKKAVKMHHYCLCLACFKSKSLINKISYSYINISIRWKHNSVAYILSETFVGMVMFNEVLQDEVSL